MKKVLFFIAMAWFGFAKAQSFEDRVNAHKETSFGIKQEDVYHRHVVNLGNDEQMIIEMTDVTDYTLLKGFDSILRVAMNDIAFYKDSVQPLEHVRIDYDIKLGSDDILMRFKRYNPSANVYIKQRGNISAMKIDRDTFRVIIRKPLLERHMPMHFYNYPVQVTFVMNNYTNLYNVLADKNVITQSIDTLMQTMVPKKYCPHLELHQSYAEYNPYQYNKPLYKQFIELDHPNYGLSKKYIAKMEARYDVNLK
jgi:hypothetical protein